MKFESPFDIGNRVHMDGMCDMVGVVTYISWNGECATIEVSWWNERAHNSAWFTPWRLALA